MTKYTRRSNSTVQEGKGDELVLGRVRYFPGIYCVLVQISCFIGILNKNATVLSENCQKMAKICLKGCKMSVTF